MSERRDGHKALRWNKEVQAMETYDPNPQPKPPRFTVEELQEAVLYASRHHMYWEKLESAARCLEWIGKARTTLKEVERDLAVRTNISSLAGHLHPIIQRLLADLEGV